MGAFGSECPPQDYINPCQCFINDGGFVCNHVKSDETLQYISDYFSRHQGGYKFSYVTISLSYITRIPIHFFAHTSITKLYITKNPILQSIDEQAFKLTHIKSLVIENNTKLNSEDIFTAVKHINNLEHLKIRNQNISKIASYAFEPKFMAESKLKEIDLSYNNISSISSYAFYKLPNIDKIQLTSNNIKHIDDFGLTMSEKRSDSDHKIFINLDTNNLTLESFTLKSLENSKTNIIDISLRLNQLRSLSRNLFEPFIGLNKSNIIYCDYNPLNCDCSMKWVRDLPIDEHWRFLYFDCNRNNWGPPLSIFDLDEKDFNECQEENHNEDQLNLDSINSGSTKSRNYLEVLVISMVIFVYEIL
jgi:hypothetical protein